MRDHRFRDIVTEVQRELPIRIPKPIVAGVLRFFLKQMMVVIRRDKYRMHIIKGDINGVYKDYNIQKESFKQLADLDETNEARTPRIVLRSKINPKTIHYPRLGPNPIYKTGSR